MSVDYVPATLLREGTQLPATLAVDGVPHTHCQLTLSTDSESWAAEGSNVFSALRNLRATHLDPQGVLICLNDARRDAAVSGMLADMGDGWQVYLLPPRRPWWQPWGRRRRPPLVPTLDPAPAELVCTVAEQDAQCRKWLGD